ncbi:MAG: hypothetical protein JRE92_02485 [Deltaproteobacteria bacterium]|jgi:putative DNA primase/helicase|nr:hypothetical protein [Deltaproteobacteria bacterium]MBW2449280.1 hypothetical protein [Deltaproteobacteria bacterium]
MDFNDLQSDKLPQIDIKDKNLPIITKRAWDALIASNSPPYLFNYGNHIVRLVKREKGQILIDSLDKNKLRHVLARCANFRIFKSDEFEICPPPPYIIEDMLACPNYPLPRLSRIVNAPIFSKEGNLHLTPGYSASTECYLNYAGNIKIPKVPLHPSEDDINRAKYIILGELLYDFPFTGDSEIAHALCLLLFPFVRAIISGPSPVFVIEAPTSATGKSLLAKMLTYPSTGRIIEAMSEVQSDGEMRKRLTAVLMNSQAYVFIDNVNRKVAYSSLASVITAEQWEDRILGESRTVRLPVTSAFIITGNNPSLSSEMARRCVRIRIDTGLEQPGRRKLSEFKHPKLSKWVEMNRDQIIGSCLVLVQNWLSKGRPIPVNNNNLGSFEEWCQVMGGILEVNGIQGFLGNLDDMRTAQDIEISVWRSFTEAWWQTFGPAEVGAAELYQLVLDKDIPIDLGSGSDHSKKIRIGKKTSKMCQRLFGQLRIVFAKQQNHAQKYRLEQNKGV